MSFAKETGQSPSSSNLRDSQGKRRIIDVRIEKKGEQQSAEDKRVPRPADKRRRCKNWMERLATLTAAAASSLPFTCTCSEKKRKEKKRNAKRPRNSRRPYACKSTPCHGEGEERASSLCVPKASLRARGKA